MTLPNYVKMDDFKLPDGKTDWKSYRIAQRENGESCYKCDQYAIRSTRELGYPALCSECLRLSSALPVTHSKLIRCPQCGNTELASRLELTDREYLDEDCPTDISCAHCGYEYQIKIHISVSYESPDRLPPSEQVEVGEADEGEE